MHACIKEVFMTSQLPKYPPPQGGWYQLQGGVIAYSHPPLYVPKGMDCRYMCDPCSKETFIGLVVGTAFVVPAFFVSSSSLSYGLCAAGGITYALTLMAKTVKAKLCGEENTPLLPR